MPSLRGIFCGRSSGPTDGEWLMSEDLKVKAIQLAAEMIENLKGRAREAYESSFDVRDMVVRVTRNAAELVLELATTSDPERQDSLRESLHGAEDAIENEVAALAQRMSTETADALRDALQMGIAFAREAIPLVVEWVRDRNRDD